MPGDADFIAWVLQVAPECRSLNLHSPIGTTLAIAYLLLRPGTLITLQQTNSVMECCGLSDGLHEWSLTLSTTSRVPKPVYETLLGTLYPELISKEGTEWQFGTGARNVDRNEPYGFRFVFWRDATRRHRDRRRRGRATAKAVVAAVQAAFDVFQHIPCYPPERSGTTPGQIVMTNTKFQRDSLTQCVPSVKFPFPVPNPLYVAPPIHGTDDSTARAPAPKRARAGKGYKGNSPGQSAAQPEFLTEVLTRLETVVKLAGSTCYRAFVVQDAAGFLSGRHLRSSRRHQPLSESQQRRLEVQRKEAYTRANVGLSRAIGTTIMISPLDMAGQPGACIVTAVLQTGFAIVDTNAYGVTDVQSALDQSICKDLEMEARINGQVFGAFPLPMALCWQRHDSDSQRMVMHRLHLVLVEAPRFLPRNNSHPAYPGGRAIGLLWGYALDGEERPIWEVRPDREGWQLQHVHSGGRDALTSRSGAAAHRFWPLHRVHAYAAFGLVPSFHQQEHFLDSAPLDWQAALEPSPARLLQRLRDVRDDPNYTAGTRGPQDPSEPVADSDAGSMSELSSVSTQAGSTRAGDHWVSGSRNSVERRPRTVHLHTVEEETDTREAEIGFPSCDSVAESTITLFNATAAALAEFCHSLSTPQSALPCFQIDQIAQLPYEWPMARLSFDFPSIAASFSQNVARLAVESTLQGNPITEPWLIATCEKAAWAAAQAANVVAPLFAQVGTIDEVSRFPAWHHLESQEFWHKALYIELAGECNDLAPMTRSVRSPMVHKRSTTSISSFVLIQRQKQAPNRLPIQNVKVYFPCLFMTQVIQNLSCLNLDGASALRGSLGLAAANDAVSLGPCSHDDHQKYATLVLKAGRTNLPTLHAPEIDTPLTRELFAAGLFDVTTAFNIGSAFGQTKVRLEVKSATREQYQGDFSPEKEWHLHLPTPWDVMMLDPAKVLTLSSQACGVRVPPSELRETYGDAFVVKDLRKISQECLSLFPQDSKVLTLSNLASIFEEPGFITDSSQQHKLGQQRGWLSSQDWRNRLVECGVDPLSLASQVHKPWEDSASSASTSHRERSRGAAKGTHGGKQGAKGKKGSLKGKGNRW